MNSTIRNSLGILGCVALVCLSILLVNLSSMAISLDAVASGASSVLASSNKSIADVSKQLTGKNGLLEEYRQVALQTRKEVDAVQQTTLAERSTVAKTGDAVLQVVTDLDGVVLQSRSAVQSLQETVSGLAGTVASLKADTDAAKPAIDGATALLATLDSGSGKALGSVTGAVGHVDDLIVASRPTVDHLDSMTGHLGDGSKLLTETLGFIRDDFKPQKKGFWVNLLDKATGGLISVALTYLFPERVVIAK